MLSVTKNSPLQPAGMPHLAQCIQLGRIFEQEHWLDNGKLESDTRRGTSPRRRSGRLPREFARREHSLDVAANVSTSLTDDTLLGKTREVGFRSRAVEINLSKSLPLYSCLRRFIMW